MGRVYEAEHVEIGRRVAIKVLHAAYSRHTDVVARFRSEARAATRIGHPHIIDVFDSGTTVDGQVYFVMEFLAGRDVADLINSEGPLPFPRAIGIGREICQALAAAHRAGIVHRDMKPENVFLIERDGRKDFVKVLDFGIAKTMESISERRLTSPGMAMGTPEYMAPEQAAGGASDQRVDVYAVGAILYEMLTGRAPHEGSSLMEVLSKKATEPPMPISRLRPDVPPELERLVLRALAISPDERPQTMDALAIELGGLGGASVPVNMTPSVSTTMRVEHTRAPYIAGALAMLALLGGVGVVVVRVLRTPASVERLSPAPANVLAAPLPQQPVAPPDERPAPKVNKPDPPSHQARPASSGKPSRSPTEPGDRAALSEARREIADAREAFNAGRYAQAESLYNQVNASGYERGQALYGLSQISFQRGNYHEAVRLARRAVQAGAGVEAKMVLGNSYFQLEQFREAIAQYREVLRIDRNHREARTNLAAAEKRRGN
jgi:serine/threonine protein kinase